MRRFDRISENDPTLCLSGGGFRAALFHLGALLRLNELGLLSRIAVISSVSGGSILNGILAARWSSLVSDSTHTFRNFDEIIRNPLRAFCQLDLRTPLLLGHGLNPLKWFAESRSPFTVSANDLSRSYDALFEGKLLADVPESSSNMPRFVFCATSVNTGACWHFHSGPLARMGEFYTGYSAVNDIRLSEAVAASSAFPLAFSAFELDLARLKDVSRVDPWGATRPLSGKRNGVTLDRILLTDGGVYDNLGVEPVWQHFKTILSSDAGRPFESAARCSQVILSRLKRVASISEEQVGAVRKRWLIEQYLSKTRVGTLWAINTNVEDYPLDNARSYSPEVRRLFSAVRTDLNSFSQGEIACLENHGYALADAAIRSRTPQLATNLSAEFAWPNPDWADDKKANVCLRSSADLTFARDLVKWLLRPLRRPTLRS
jgi:NTE family protein